EEVSGKKTLDVTLIPEGTIRGRVVGAQDGRPVAHALVSLWPRDVTSPIRTAQLSTATDESGKFALVGVAPGRHRVQSFVDGRSSGLVNVTVDAGRESEDVVLRLDEIGAVVRGAVRDGDGRPLAGARVFAVLDGRWFGGLPPTDANGAFEVAIPYAGTVAI